MHAQHTTIEPVLKPCLKNRRGTDRAAGAAVAAGRGAGAALSERPAPVARAARGRLALPLAGADGARLAGGLPAGGARRAGERRTERLHTGGGAGRGGGADTVCRRGALRVAVARRRRGRKTKI